MLRHAALALVLALGAGQSAHADGDPAMDILASTTTRVYMTDGANGPKLEQGLERTAQQLTDGGFPVKVAIIGDRSDLGAVPQLWGKPQTYATFLGAELRFVYKDTLLVVMPQGFGIHGPYARGKALAALQGIDPRVDRSPTGLTATADRAMRALAAADGHTASSSAGEGGGGLPWPFIAAGVMVVAGAGGGALILRGEKKSRPSKSRRR